MKWLLLLSFVLVSSCVRVKSYQRETLAERAMQTPVWEKEGKVLQHVFEIREGTAGAGGSAGGGCGCN